MNMKKNETTHKFMRGNRKSAWIAYTAQSKQLKLATALVIFFTSTGLLFAADEAERKPKIVIYNFQMLKPEPEEAERRKKQKDYGYYSIILPETISKKLGESERFLINRGKKYLLNNEPDPIDIIRENYSKELTSAAKPTSSDYVITGQFEVKNDILNVRIFIYNVMLNELQEVTASGKETGIYLKDTPDSLSDDIEERIKDIIVEQIDKDTKSQLPALSHYMSAGFDAGYIYMSGKYKGIFSNTQYYSPYISFNIARYFDLILKFDHFTTDSYDEFIYSDYYLSVMSGSALLGLKYQVFSNMGIYLTAGGGVSRSELTVDTGEPFTVSTSIKKETDPVAEAGFGLKVNISSFYLRTGVLYKRIFTDEDPMDLRIIYGGAGIHF